MRKWPRASVTFLVLGSIIGLTMVVVTPPFQVPDEDAHFFRAYQTSTFNLKLEKRGNRVGADLPGSIWGTWELFKGIPLNPSRKVDASLYARAMSLNGNDRVFCSPILPYTPVVYAAQAAGMLVGRAAGAPPIISFYLARIMNLALFLLMITCAIRWMPVMRWGLALLALMPMTMYLAASLSADTATIGISILMIAFILNCAAGEGRLTVRDILFLFAGTLLLALVKQGYSPLIVLALLIPANRFGSRLRKGFIIGGMLALAAAIGIGCIAAMHNYTWGLPGSDSSEQLRFIVAHPLHYLGILFRVPFRASYFGSFIGWFGWLETRLPLWIIVPYGLMLLAVPLAERRSFHLSTRQRLLTGALFVFIVALVFTTQLLSFTPVGKMSIDGVQGRYFIPMSPLLLLLFNTRKFSFSIEDHAIARHVLVAFIIFVHAVGVAMLVNRYYPIS